MSVHIVAGENIMCKRGGPGNRSLIELNEVFSAKELQHFLHTQLHGEEIKREIKRNHSFVLQLGRFRVVIVTPPLVKRTEISIVSSTTLLELDDYELTPEQYNNLTCSSKGILITGAPGEGKTTFTQALTGFLFSQKNIIKTIESPRDLQVNKSISQYSSGHASHDEIRDILLLSRPNFTVFDEIRNQSDFLLFKDLRLAGVGMIGVMHATKPIDSIQRMIGTIETGLIAEIIDTVVYIKGGKINKMFTLEQKVTTPVGMGSPDLARPVIEISDCESKKVEYQIYSYGDSVVVMPISGEENKKDKNKNDLSRFTKIGVELYLKKNYPFDLLVEVESQNHLLIYASNEDKPRIIGKGGEKIRKLESDLGCSISVRSVEEIPNKIERSLITTKKKGKNTHIEIDLGEKRANEEINLGIKGKIFSFRANYDGKIIIRRKKLVDQALTFGVSEL